MNIYNDNLNFNTTTKTNSAESFKHAKSFVKFFLVICLTLFSFNFTACKKRDDLNKISANLTNYEMDIDLDYEKKSFTAVEKVDYINSSDAILKQVKFHLYPKYFALGATDCVVSQTKVNNCYKNGMSYCEFNIKRLQVGDKDVGVVYEGEHDGILNVNLTNSLMPSERVNIIIEFQVEMPNCEHRFGYGADTLNLANFYPIACVYNSGFSTNPYNANGDPFYSDMANYNVSLTLNSNLVVAGTGTQTELSQKQGKTKTQFKAQAVRDFAMVVSDKFEVKTAKAGKVEVNYFYYNDTNADLSIKAGVDAINTFSNKFGAYPYATFSIVKCDFLYGGMEYPNLVMISDEIEGVDDYLNVIVHETAHQWWYGMVGNDEYTLPWLDEALTDYCTILFYDYNEGYNLTHDKMIEANHKNFSLFVSVYKDVLGSVDTSMRAVNEYATEPEYTYCTYVKGCLMYESLYKLIGEKKFINALQIYFENNKYQNANVEDLISAFSSANNSDMHPFFESWISNKVVIN